MCVCGRVSRRVAHGVTGVCDCGGWAQVLVVASGVGYYGYLPSEAEVTRTAPGSPNQLEPRRRLPPDDSDACMPLSGPVSEGFPGRLSESQRGGRGAGRGSGLYIVVWTIQIQRCIPHLHIYA